MARASTRPKRNNLRLPRHARQRMSERGLWPVLGHIAFIAHSRHVPRIVEQSASGQKAERLELDGVVIVVSQPLPDGSRYLITAFCAHDECGPAACARIRSVSSKIAKSRAA